MRDQDQLERSLASTVEPSQSTSLNDMQRLSDVPTATDILQTENVGAKADRLKPVVVTFQENNKDELNSPGQRLMCTLV
ncbi:hypothetical protein [Endozoicomonas sp.]|uniref:hypothetical protein n=1 Tax=Endozoicomonas sp. TaxID=1892382 RepID=UPI002884497C|nr:hypothetical protein [Endozoicomonas sp.]